MKTHQQHPGPKYFKPRISGGRRMTPIKLCTYFTIILHNKTRSADCVGSCWKLLNSLKFSAADLDGQTDSVYCRLKPKELHLPPASCMALDNYTDTYRTALRRTADSCCTRTAHHFGGRTLFKKLPTSAISCGQACTHTIKSIVKSICSRTNTSLIVFTRCLEASESAKVQHCRRYL